MKEYLLIIVGAIVLIFGIIYSVSNVRSGQSSWDSAVAVKAIVTGVLVILAGIVLLN